MKEINNILEFPEVNTWDDIIEQIKKLQNGSIFLWLFDRVLSGKLENGVLIWSNDFPEKFHPGLIAELRAFNDNAEFKVWRSATGLKARSRKDGIEGTKIYVKDAELVLWGTKGEQKNGFTELVENRGTTVILAGDFTIKEGDSKRVVAVVRHYVGFSGADAVLAGYEDYRFLKLKTV